MDYTGLDQQGIRINSIVNHHSCCSSMLPCYGAREPGLLNKTTIYHDGILNMPKIPLRLLPSIVILLCHTTVRSLGLKYVNGSDPTIKQSFSFDCKASSTRNIAIEKNAQ